MTAFYLNQTSFVGGEISPRLRNRTDLKTYFQSVQSMANAYPLTHGGATRRRGTSFIGEVRDSTRPVRLIRYVFSRTQSYVLVFNGESEGGEGCIQMIRDKQWVMDGSERFELSHPYSDDELKGVTYAQVGTVMIFCHRNHTPYILRPDSGSGWVFTSSVPFIYNALSNYPFEDHVIQFQIIAVGDGHSVQDEYEVKVYDDGTYEVTGRPGGSPTPTGDIVAIAVNQNAKPSSGTYYLYTITCIFKNGDREEWQVVRASKNEDNDSLIESGAPPAQWGEGNYPGAVAFYEQRLYFGGSTIWPQRIWGSTLGDYFNLTRGPLDSDGVDFQIASNSYDEIVHLESARALLPLTYGAEFSMSGPAGATITPNAVSIRAHTFHGTTNVRPIRIGQEVLFVQRDGKKVRALSYDLALDANVAPDLTLLAEHITQEGITDMTYAQDPDAIMWVVRGDGELCSLTHMREQEVTAWARHTTQGSFLAVCAIPESEGDTVYTAVQREIDGASLKYIEYLSTDAYVDSSITMNAETGTDVWTGLDHLEGEEVTIVADGFVHPARTVEGGSLTLARPATTITVGLPYTSRIELLHPEIPMNDGTSQGRQARIPELTIRLQDTIGLNVNGRPQPVLDLPLTLDEPPELFTGEITVKANTGWQYPLSTTLTQDLPMPFTVLGVISLVEVND